MKVSLSHRVKSGISWLRSPRGHDLFFALLGQAGPTVLQLVFFITTARILGAESTGIFFLIVAVSVIGSAFVGFGSGGLVMREVSRDPKQASRVFGQALGISITTFFIVFLPVIYGAWYLTDGLIPWWVISLIASADLLASRLLTTTWSLFIAKEEQLRAAAMICIMPLSRTIVSLLVFFVETENRFQAFVLVYFVSSFATLLIILYLVQKKIGTFALSVSGFDYKSGSSFSLTWFNAAIQSESEKVLLGLFGNPAMVAVYSIAMRLMDGAAMPPRAARVAVQARLFRSGVEGTKTIFNMTVKILPAVVIYGLIVWFGFYLFAPLVSKLFGTGFELLASILPVLGLLPLLRGISEFGAEIFLSSDSPSIQAMTQTLVTAIRLGLGILLISNFQINGAIYTGLTVTTLSGFILWTLAWLKSQTKKT